MKSRKERREEARENGLAFEPQYKGRVITKSQYDQEAKEHKEFLKNLRNGIKKVKQQSEETTTTTTTIEAETTE